MGKMSSYAAVTTPDRADYCLVVTSSGVKRLTVAQALSLIQVGDLPSTVTGGVDYQGTWNASTNSPNLGSLTPSKGDYYVVSVAGSTSLGGITSWGVGDWAIYNGAAWQKVDNQAGGGGVANGELRLLSETLISLSITTPQVLYTAPAGIQMTLDRVLMVRTLHTLPGQNITTSVNVRAEADYPGLGYLGFIDVVAANGVQLNAFNANHWLQKAFTSSRLLVQAVTPGKVLDVVIASPADAGETAMVYVYGVETTF